MFDVFQLHARHSGARGGAEGGVSRTRNPDMFSAKHSEIPGSHFSGSAAYVRPGMTSVDRDSPPLELEWLKFACA